MGGSSRTTIPSATWSAGESHPRHDRAARWPARRCRLSSGLVFWDPQTGKRHIRARRRGIPDDSVLRLQLDTMVDPPALHVANARRRGCAESASLTRSLARPRQLERVDGRCTYGGRD